MSNLFVERDAASNGMIDVSLTHPLVINEERVEVGEKGRQVRWWTRAYREIIVPKNVTATYLILFCGGDDSIHSSTAVDKRPGHHGKPTTRAQTAVDVGDVF
jgi:hypothetical protein